MRLGVIFLSCKVAFGLRSPLVQPTPDDERIAELRPLSDVPTGPSALLLPSVDKLPGTFSIPPILHQTTELVRDCIPDHFSLFTDGIERRITTDQMNIEFLKTYFHPRVAATYDKMVMGQHKADLYRYAALYIHGGIYADIKVMPVTPLLSLFANNFTKFTWYSTVCFKGACAFNGFMATPPRNSHFLSMIDYIVEHAPPSRYHEYVERDAALLMEQYGFGMERNELQAGIYDSADSTLVLMDEDCSVGPHTRINDGDDEITEHSHGTRECAAVGGKTDLYGYCCNIYAGEWGSEARRLVAHTRDPGYPYEPQWKQCVPQAVSLSIRPENEMMAW